jgi:dTDP-4-amino-4,6-dideoxygalactose transaminase
MKDQRIFVTKAFMPAKEEFLKYVEKIFSSRSLTNQGELARELEDRLAAYLKTPHVLACANGTLALMMGLRLAALGGKKVVTTPFTYVATLSAIMWEGCIPVFADIDPETLCLSPESLRECLKLHPDVAGVVPVHIFGNACDVQAIEAICREHGIVCLYDAAQTFGASYGGRSLLAYGDYSICSFHATKVFHAVEGGCLVVHSQEDKHQAVLLRAFGHLGDEHYSLGFNAKLSELHAAMGLCLLDKAADNIAKRKAVSALYDAALPKRGLRRPALRPGLVYNYAYYPVIFDSEEVLLRVRDALRRENIFPRRYFFPALNTLPYLPAREQSCPVAESVARRVLCLPLYGELEERAVAKIAAIIKSIV